MAYNLKNPKGEVNKLINRIISPQKIVTIILDAAHGSDIAGKRSPDGKHREYLWSRMMIKKLLPKLKSLGYTVEQTNTTDIEIGLSKRKTIADSIKGEYKALISLHNDAAGMGDKWMKATGYTFYTTKGQTVSDVLSEFLYKAFSESFPDEKARTDITDTDSDKEENFTVLMGKTYWAVLAEMWFQDSLSDVEKLSDESFQNRIIEAIISGIEMFNTWVIDYYIKK